MYSIPKNQVNALRCFYFFKYYLGLLTGFHYIHLLIGMILSRITSEFYNYSHVNMGTVAMVVVNLLALLAVDDPPYYRMKFCEKWTSILNLDYNLQIQDYYHAKMLHNNCFKVCYKTLNIIGTILLLNVFVLFHRFLKSRKTIICFCILRKNDFGDRY